MNFKSLILISFIPFIFILLLLKLFHDFKYLKHSITFAILRVQGMVEMEHFLP